MTILKFSVHPGRILLDEYLKPAGISSGMLAAHINVPRTRIERLIKEETNMSVDTALRLSKALGTTAEFWLNLQTAYDLNVADARRVGRIEPLEMRA